MSNILLLSDINSAHTRKWAEGLAELGFRIAIFSISQPQSDWYSAIGIQNLRNSQSVDAANSTVAKLGYLSLIQELRKAITLFMPDLVHSHYASSYGLLGALTSFHPYIVSVWGSDVFAFPKESFIKKQILKFNLSRADAVFSTSKIMAIETAKYTSKKIDITPFGIDTKIFFPSDEKHSSITVGIIKSMEEKYGIPYLIEAFSNAVLKFPSVDLKLLLVGGGDRLDEYKSIVTKFSLNSKVKFTGKVPQEDVPALHRLIDIFVCPSIDDSESFGVSVLEASACGVPVIVSAVGGLKEVVINNVTGLIVPAKDVLKLTDALSILIVSESERKRMGVAGKEHVKQNYDWTKNLNDITDIYHRMGVK